MALFDVGSLPPWMIQRESPGDTLVRGIQAGSQIAHNVLAARNFALEQQESIIRQQNTLKIREGLAAFGAYMGKVDDWTSVESEKGAYAVAAKYPWIMSTPAFQQGMSNFEKARTAKADREARERIAETNASVRSDIALLRSMEKDADRKARLDLFRERVESGLSLTYEQRVELEGFKHLYRTSEIEARHDARLEEIDARIQGTITNAPKMIRNQARVTALQSELRQLENDVRLRYKPDDKKKAFDAIIKKYDVDVTAETIPTVPGVTPSAPAPPPPNAPAPVAGPPASAAPKPSAESQQLRYAREAIKAGIPKERVAAEYKRQTGMDYPE